MSEIQEWLPLFPLSQPVFPGTRLDLQIFEQRYIKLVRSSMREQSPFGISAILQGAEVGLATRLYSTGSEVSIVDFRQLQNGLLGITVEAGQRFAIEQTEVDPDGLVRARIQYLEPDPDEAIPEWCSGLVELYTELRNHQEIQKRLPELESIGSVGLGNGLAQVLPMSIEERIHCLGMTDAIQRLEFLVDHIHTLSSPA